MVRKVHFVTGKGGVGKSLVAAALARHLSLKNQPILLAELNETSFYKDYLKLEKISYKPLPWSSSIDICQWSPEDCLKEYALHLIKIESLYKLFIENPVSKSLIQIAPGLQELALLGKITSSPRKHGPPMNYDEVVIDSYSSGHFLSLMRAPSAMAEAIQFGPMGDQSRSIDSWISNTDFTQIHIVTLAEELPITESIELYQKIQIEFKIKPKFYLNKTLGLRREDLKSLDDKARLCFEDVILQEEKSRAELLKNKIHFTELPLVTSLDSEVLVQTLSAGLHD